MQPAIARAIRAITTFVAIVALVLGAGLVRATAEPTPRPTPTSAEDARRAKENADRRLAELEARIAVATERIAQLETAAENAEDEFKAQLEVQANAEAAERAASAALQAARRGYEKARTALAGVVVANYTGASGLDAPGSASVISLLTAEDPNLMLVTAAYRELAGDYQAEVTQRMINAVEARKAAEARQKAALEAVTVQTAKLRAIRERARKSLAQARDTVRTLRADMQAAKLSQAEAEAMLSTFIGGWTIADPEQAAALNRKYAALAAMVAGLPRAPDNGTWTPQIGQSVVNRTIQWIGTPYAWAGGNSHGPTRGVCAGDGAANDCRVIGFDCSGLVLYGWAPYTSMEHFAATQYVQAGRMHPSVTQLRPGDLVFWSNNRAASGIHHVAMYIGDGNVVQAPQSGDIVRITPLAKVASGYYGATRPLT